MFACLMHEDIGTILLLSSTLKLATILHVLVVLMVSEGNTVFNYMFNLSCRLFATLSCLIVNIWWSEGIAISLCFSRSVVVNVLTEDSNSLYTKQLDR